MQDLFHRRLQGQVDGQCQRHAFIGRVAQPGVKVALDPCSANHLGAVDPFAAVAGTTKDMGGDGTVGIKAHFTRAEQKARVANIMDCLHLFGTDLATDPQEPAVAGEIPDQPGLVQFGKNTDQFGGGMNRVDHLAGLGVKGVKKVSLHEPLTGLLRVTIITVDPETPRTEVWRALYGAASFKGDCGKITIAVNEDIDADNADAILWAMGYRLNPDEDVEVLRHRGQGHGPKRESSGEEDSTLLIDATMKSPMPPLALPTKPYMEAGKELWDKLGLPELRPESPWHGYSLGDWSQAWTDAADRAAAGDWPENGRRTLQRQVPADVTPETSVRDVEEGWEDETEWKKQ